MRTTLIIAAITLVPASASRSRMLEVRAYCPCAVCCGEWADGITASGRVATLPGVASRSLPFGTAVFIECYGKAVVDDRGPNLVEVRFPTHREALEWGVRVVAVKIGDD